MRTFGIVVRILLALGVAVVAGVAVYVTQMANRHEVIPGRLYRCSQPSANSVRELVEKHGIRTVLNLRGLSSTDSWYFEECQACASVGISQEDITLSAKCLPPPQELRRAVEVLDRAEYPILIHCKAGADRTGMISAMALLLTTDATVDEARKQLLPRYGHFRFGRTAAMDEFLDLYEAALARSGEAHSRERFRHWVLDEYSPGPARAKLEWIDAAPSYPEQRPFAATIRGENASDTAWELKPGTFAGIYAHYRIVTSDGGSIYQGRTGFRYETVPPGASTNFIVTVPALPAGRYRLIVELQNATGAGIPFRTNTFGKFGDGPLLAEFTVG